MSNMIHKTVIENYRGDISELAKDIGDLRYDTLAEFLGLLSDKINNDGKQDDTRGRVKLAKQLRECAFYLKHSKTNISEAWKISEPFMK